MTTRCEGIAVRWNDPLPVAFAQCGYGVRAMLHLLAGLLPIGEVWPRDPGSAQMALLRAFASLLGLPDDPPDPRDPDLAPSLETRLCTLLSQSDPRTVDELLGRWERWLGLPDPCLPPTPTLELRRRMVAFKELARGGQTPAYYVALAGLLGYEIEIEEPRPLHAGCARMGQRLACDPFTWIVHVRCIEATPGLSTLRAGCSPVCLPVGPCAEDLLACLLDRLKPAHTQVIILYGSRTPICNS